MATTTRKEPPSLRFLAWLRARAALVAVAVSVAASCAVVLAVVRSPGVTLGYVHTLAWPMAAATLLVVFRRPLEALIDRIQEGNVSTPMGGVAFQSPSAGATKPGQSEPAPESAPSPEPSAAPTPTSNTAETEALELELEQWRAYGVEVQERMELLTYLNQIFEGQLAFLRWLSAAPDGVTAAAVFGYFDSLQKSNPIWAPLQSKAMTDYLFANHLIEVLPSGNYALTETGRKLVELSGQMMYAQKTA